MELLRIADVAEGNFVEGVGFVCKFVPVLPFFSSVWMVFARVGTTPLTAYSASLTHGFISFQKNGAFFDEKVHVNFLSILIAISNIL